MFWFIKDKSRNENIPVPRRILPTYMKLTQRISKLREQQFVDHTQVLSHVEFELTTLGAEKIDVMTA